MTAFGEYADDDSASALKARDYKDATDLVCSVGGGVAHTLTTSHDASEDGTGRGTPVVSVHGTQDPIIGDNLAHALGRNHGAENAVLESMQVRRLTPIECERLQGFKDNYTRIPWKKKYVAECPDGPRYKALGNSWPVPVPRWIAERIIMELTPCT